MIKILYRLMLYIIIITLYGAFTGCGITNTNLEASASVQGEKMALEIMRCFSEQDKEALKSMFSEKVRNLHNLDSEIEEAFKIMNKPIISHDKILVGESKEVSEGIIIRNSICVHTNHVILSDDEKYLIVFSACLEGEKEDKVGVAIIDIKRAWEHKEGVIHEPEEPLCTIGEWV